MEENEVILDERDEEKIRGQIAELAAAFVPEWNFSDTDPDIGSVIALIYAGQMAENIGLFNGIFFGFRTAFADLTGTALRPAAAARSIVVMEAQDAGGAAVGKGTKLLARARNGERLIFETMDDLFVSGAGLTDIVGICGQRASIRSYRGEMEGLSLFSGPAEEGGKDREKREIWKQELILYHEWFSCPPGEEVALRFRGEQPEDQTGPGPRREKSGADLARLFTDRSRYRFLFADGERLTEPEEVRQEGDRIVLRKKKAGAGEETDGDGKENGALVLRQLAPERESELRIRAVELFGEGGSREPAYVSDDTVQLENACFWPFGEELSQYQVCYIGEDMVFSRKDARIWLEFGLDFEEKNFAVYQEEGGKLPLVRRKPKYQIYERPFLCRAEEVSFEYYNGVGWKRLQMTAGAESLLCGAKKDTGGRPVRIGFRAPRDWQSVQTGAYRGRCLRIRVVRAPNCHMRPAIHIVPVIRDLRLFYDHGKEAAAPDRAMRLSGRCLEDLTPFLEKGLPCPIFIGFPYQTGNCLYLGFQDKWPQGPAGLFFRTGAAEGKEKDRILWEYSTGNGWRELWVKDHTDDLSHSGIVMFEPPSDMGRQELEGIRRYWIRLRDEWGGRPKLSRFGQGIREILTNAVMVHNMETAEAEEYYMDTVSPDMEFPLYGDNLLEAEVWVNEIRQLSRQEMACMLGEHPDRARAEYDQKGRIAAFYVKWEEAEDLSQARDGARLYRIDRMNNRLVFGDGIRARIPGCTTDTAFYVIRRSCRGSLGNVETGSIDSFYGSMPPVRSVRNPVDGFGGSDPESVEHAVRRSAGIFNGRRRLISENDYVREALTFSENVAQASCVYGVDRYGRKREGRISLVILMKDHGAGEQSFQRLRRELGQYLQEMDGGRCGEVELWIEPPVFTEVSLEVWLRIPDVGEGLSVRRQWQERIRQYLEPGEGPGRGWQIGDFPKEEQIRMMLRGMEQECRVERYAVRAAVRDRNGTHEVPFEKAGGNPFGVCCCGVVEVYGV